jgi:hypothetical protein
MEENHVEIGDAPDSTAEDVHYQEGQSEKVLYYSFLIMTFLSLDDT